MEKSGCQGRAGSKPLTTFVQADTNTFREVVQRLTGPSESEAAHEEPSMKVVGVKRPTFKLHERRQYTRSKLEIVKPSCHFKSGSSVLQPHIPGFHSTDQKSFSPSKSGNSGFVQSHLSTPSTTLSNLSILEEENKGESASSDLNSQEEERAIKERRFYLHPSPRSRPGYMELELLTLFPLTSPKTSDKP